MGAWNDWTKVLIFASVISTFFACEAIKSGNETGLLNSKIISDADFITRKPFLDVPQLGSVSDIGYLDRRSYPDNAIVVVGRNISLIYEKGVVRNFSKFSGSNALLYLNHSSVDSSGPIYFSLTSPAAVYDSLGTSIWSQEFNGQFMDMAAGDINGDSVVEFGIGYNEWRTGGFRDSNDVLSTRGMLLLNDVKGNTLWKKTTEEIWRLAFVDINDDGKEELLSSDYNGNITIRDENGDTVGSYPRRLGRNFSVCRWPDKNSPVRFLFSKNEKIWIADLQGNILTSYKAPGAHEYEARGTPIKFEVDQNPYFAVIVKVRAAKKEAALFIYSPQGMLVYHEILPVLYVALLAFQDGSSDIETLLVGGEDIVWQYSRKKPQPLAQPH